ncbi:hypothetical protein L226DRAFT_607764 [Lentinus tigrinus ALCF2SS1-7]|uniref:Uncharacterized protein n=1 Tax=Lentinus tigrinus ALCF2SS1-6 TaxID=1328759 RepID=A0A5C2SH22_9APHY|nr:hypothetical protein L227DRAFT_651335 [Lentinus tigrinus ALCF2SS1-6]RPD82675.1 hypothetical protein L226DRAFT_607764 [Lentinus tigrinus ALCF2SS1-7]
MPRKCESPPSKGLVKRADDSREEATLTDQRLAAIQQRLAFLCHDLRTFSTNEDAVQRLSTSVHTHFLGSPYLSPQDAQFVQTCDLALLRGPNVSSVSGNTGDIARATLTLPTYLEEGMDELVKARRAKSEHDPDVKRDFVLCTSHDLAPLLQEACGFSKQYFETRAFKAAYKRWEKDVRKAEKKGGTGL